MYSLEQLFQIFQTILAFKYNFTVKTNQCNTNFEQNTKNNSQHQQTIQQQSIISQYDLVSQIQVQQKNLQKNLSDNGVSSSDQFIIQKTYRYKFVQEFLKLVNFNKLKKNQQSSHRYYYQNGLQCKNIAQIIIFFKNTHYDYFLLFNKHIMINSDFSSLSNFRGDGRKDNQLRDTFLQLGVDPNYDGSCIYRQGLTQVLCLVNGPYQKSNPNDTLLKIEYTVAPFSSIQKRKIKFDREFSQFTESIRKSFQGIIIAETYSKSQIQVIVTVIENEGSAKSCVINSITLALANAGICMKDLLVSTTVAKSSQNQFLVDTNEEEQYETDNEILVSYLQRQGKIDYIELRKAKLKEQQLVILYDRAIKGCEQLYKRIRKSLIDFAQKKMLVF